MALVLVGRSVLAQHLSRQPYESFRQRIVVDYRMEGLGGAGTKAYVREMLLEPGADPDIFDDAALVTAHGVSDGSIRRLSSARLACARMYGLDSFSAATLLTPQPVEQVEVRVGRLADVRIGEPGLARH